MCKRTFEMLTASLLWAEHKFNSGLIASRKAEKMAYLAFVLFTLDLQ